MKDVDANEVCCICGADASETGIHISANNQGYCGHCMFDPDDYDDIDE